MKAQQAKNLSLKAIKSTADPIIFLINNEIKERTSAGYFDLYYKTPSISDTVLNHINSYYISLGYTVGFDKNNLVISWD